jgi:hypothetical protein
MSRDPYLVISGVIFGVVALLHFLRVVNGWAFEVGPWSVPMWVSWLGTVGPAVLCVWAFRLASRSH